MMLKEGEYYTAEELAKKAHMSRVTVFRWLKKKKIKPTYIGDLLRFYEGDVKHLFKYGDET